MKEEKLISVTVFMDAMANALSKVVDDDTKNRVIEALKNSIEYASNRYQQLVFLRGIEKDECVHLDKVAWLEADGSYTKFHSIGGKMQVLSANIASTLRQLESYGYSNFLRIHHSYAVNTDYVIARCGNTLYIDQKEITIGRSYKKYFEEHCVTLKK